MKTSPRNLAFFFLAVTIYRAAVFMADGLSLNWVGTSLAIGSAAGVYVASYFLGRLPILRGIFMALPVLALFWVVDTAFNMLEVVRTLSTANFVPSNANFLNMSAADIRWAMQWAGLVVGVFPSTATAMLGLLQGQANTLNYLDNKSFFGQIQLAILAKIGYKNTAPEANQPVIITRENENSPRITGNSKMIAKSSLTAEQRSALPTLTDGQIVSMYGIKPRTARKWKADVKNNTW